MPADRRETHPRRVGQLAGPPGTLSQFVDHLPPDRVGESDEHLVHFGSHSDKY